MKTMVFDIQDPAAGDMVIINASAPKGGKISAKYIVLGARVKPVLDDGGFIVRTDQLPADTGKDIAANLSAQINSGWMPECVKAKVKPETGVLILNCTDLFTDVIFTSEVHGEGGTKVVMSEF